MKSGNHL